MTKLAKLHTQLKEERTWEENIYKEGERDDKDKAVKDDKGK